LVIISSSDEQTRRKTYSVGPLIEVLSKYGLRVAMQRNPTRLVFFCILFTWRRKQNDLWNNGCNKLKRWNSVVGWGTMLQAGRSQVRVPMRWIFLNLPNPSGRTMALGSTQPLTEMSTRNLPGG
jgi:hypothetical protein